MAIIRYEGDLLTTSFYYNQLPDHYVSESKKNSKKYMKTTMDYYSTVAFNQYNNQQEGIDRNYKLLKGIIDKAHLYEDDEQGTVSSFMDTLSKKYDLPSYVKHYSIIAAPINALVGELSARPDNVRIKAFDDDSKSEELEAKTDFLHQYIQAKFQQKIAEQLQQSGYQEGTQEYDEQLANMTGEQVQEYMISYTSTAEDWANKILTALKAHFNIKEKSEEAFRDLLVTSREYFYVYEDKSRIGFNIRVLNPKNVWYLTTPDKKYTKEAYACGVIQVMELSEILATYDLTAEEIEYLNQQAKGFFMDGTGVRRSNLLPGGKEGQNSITYDVYDPLVAKYKTEAESALMAEQQLNTFLGIQQAGYSTYGSKFVVVTNYWNSKRKVGKLTYWDEDEQEEKVIFVDESYRTTPNEISLEWTWEDQWRKGTKIGPHVYTDYSPLKMLDYPPILGLIFESKNTPTRSLVDLMKNFQSIYDICINKLYQLTRKDKGVQMVVSMRYIPKSKEGTYDDAINEFMMKAEEEGIMFVDDSPENTKGGGTFAQTGAYNLSRSKEIESYLAVAQQIKNECYSLAGFSQERLGDVAASQTATGTNAALARSFTQTEPYFVAHEYLLQQLYQAIVDVAQYIESKKPTSTVTNITNQGDSAFIQITGSEIKLRDFHVYVSSSAEDQRLFGELRGLAQPMLQNGATPYEIAILYSTNSVRQMKEIFRKLKEQKDQFEQQQQQIEQQKVQQQAEQFKEMQDHEDLVREEEISNENYQKELDRVNKKEIAIISSLGYGKVSGEDDNANGVPDIMETAQFTQSINQANQVHQKELAKIDLDRQKLLSDRDMELKKIALEKDKLAMEGKRIKADLAIKKQQQKQKSKPKK